MQEQEEKKPKIMDMQYITTFKQCHMIVNKQKHAFCSVGNPSTNTNVINECTKEVDKS